MSGLPRRRRSSLSAKPKRSSISSTSAVLPTSSPEKNEKEKEKTEVVIDNERGNWDKWNVRTKSTLIILAMFAVLIAIGQLALWGLVVVIQTAMFREVVKLGKVVAQERQSPEQTGLQWYWFSVSMLLFNGRMLILNFRSVESYMQPFIKYHTIVCFVLYIAGIIWFVVTLKKGFYKYQFAQFGWAHLTLLLVVYTCHFAIKNMFNGLIWFALPSLLVICNDIFAYIFGFFFGKRWFKSPLIELSPKKTWEGFIGASAVTLLFGFFVSKIFSLYPMFICPKLDVSFGYDMCEVAQVFIPELYEVPQVIKSFFSFVCFYFDLLFNLSLGLPCNMCPLHLFKFMVFLLLFLHHWSLHLEDFWLLDLSVHSR